MEFKLIRIIFALFSVQNLFAIATSQATNQQGAAGSATTTTTAKKGWIYESEDRFCIPRQNRPPFTRSTLDGAVCCKGTVLQAATVLPEVTGECAMKSKTDENGMLHPAPLWCSYTCSLKKLGFIDAAGNVKPAEFFNHLAKVLGPKTKEQVKTAMAKYLKCMTPFKNPKFPCFTPLGFHKCYNDALEVLCTKGFPQGGDFSKYPDPKADYVNIQPTCEIGGKQVMPGCCHGRPLPWTIPDIIEAPRNKTKKRECMTNMNNGVCEATCFLNSAGVVDDSMELDVDKFEKTLLGLFPVVKPSDWMNYLGPVFLFFNEAIEEMSATTPVDLRVCLFHDKILNFHEDKIQQYCSMTPQEVKQIMTQK